MAYSLYIFPAIPAETSESFYDMVVSKRGTKLRYSPNHKEFPRPPPPLLRGSSSLSLIFGRLSRQKYLELGFWEQTETDSNFHYQKNSISSHISRTCSPLSFSSEDCRTRYMDSRSSCQDQTIPIQRVVRFPLGDLF